MRVTRLISFPSLAGAAFAHTPLRRQLYNVGDPNESVAELRRRLRDQLKDKLPRFKTIETESRLIVQLSRSPQAGEREEALEMGEGMWEELHDPAVVLPHASRSAMKVALCSSLRRCALVSKNREVAETWTVRFAERASSISPEDFMERPQEDGEVLGWREARAQARPGTGIDADDLEADAREESEAKAAGQQKGQKKTKSREPTPFERFRQQKMMEHPTIELAFRRRPGPGPRYTG